jgi:hypothetical protein
MRRSSVPPRETTSLLEQPAQSRPHRRHRAKPQLAAARGARSGGLPKRGTRLLHQSQKEMSFRLVHPRKLHRYRTAWIASPARPASCIHQWQKSAHSCLGESTVIPKPRQTSSESTLAQGGIPCLDHGGGASGLLESARTLACEAHLGRRSRLEDDDCGLSWASCGVTVEVLVQFTPALPQPFTFPTDCGPAAHLAPDPACELDDRLGIGLQVQPPGWAAPQPFMAIETRLGPSSK